MLTNELPLALMATFYVDWDKINSAAGNGQKSETDEDMHDKSETDRPS